MSKRRSRAGFKEASGLKHDVHSALRAPAAFAEWEYLDLSSRGVPGRHSERDLLALTPEASNLTSTLDASRSFNKTSRSSTSGSRRSRASSNGVNGKAVVDEGSSSTSTHADVVPPSSSRVVSSAPLLASTSNGSRHRRRVSLPQELISGNGDLGSSSHKAVTKSDVQDEDEEAFLLRYLGPVAGTSLQHSHAQSTFQSSSSTSSSSPQSPVVPPSPHLANSFTAIPAAKPGSFAARALERSRLSDRGRKKFIVQQRQDAGLDGVSEAQPPLPLLSPERLPSPQSQPLPQDLPFWLRSEASDEVHADEASSHSSVGQGTSNVLRGGPQTTPASVRQQAFQQQQQQQQQFVGRVHRRGESVHAAVVLQRCWRGYLARVFVWQRNGPGAAWMATKIQAVMRGCLARAFVVSFWSGLIAYKTHRPMGTRVPLLAYIIFFSLLVLRCLSSDFIAVDSWCLMVVVRSHVLTTICRSLFFHVLLSFFSSGAASAVSLVARGVPAARLRPRVARACGSEARARCAHGDSSVHRAAGLQGEARQSVV
jgi:hypothetical protein